MNLLKNLEVLSNRQGRVQASYDVLNIQELLSKHTIFVDLKAFIALSQISLFSQIQSGGVISLKKSEVNITSLETSNQQLKVKNV